MDEPRLVTYMQRYDRPDADRLDTPGEWRAEPDWPVADRCELTLHLGSGEHCRRT